MTDELNLPPQLAMQQTDIQGNGNVVVQIVGDGNRVEAGHAHLALTRYLARRRVRAGHELDLLSPYTRSVPLIGREGELRELWAFLDSGRPLAVRVLVGEGGSGKTRLALELCEQAAARGWAAGFAARTELERFFAQQNLSQWGWRRPTLMVVDYAASHARQLKDWLTELADHPGAPEKPLRLLLLERHADPQSGWWQTVFASGGWDARAASALLDPDLPVPLAPLPSAEDRVGLLQAILDSVGSPLTLPARDAGYRDRLMRLTWGGQPLFLMMAALLMKQQGSEQALALHRTDLAYALSDRERERLGRAAEQHRLDPRLLEHLAACVTLAQGVARPAFLAYAEAEKQALGRPSGGDPAVLADLLHEALPAPDQGIAPVLPDLIGEAFILRALQDPDTAVPRCHAAFGRPVTVSLIRCAQDYADPEHEPRPLRWLETLAADLADDLEGLVALADALPQQSLVLADLSLNLTQAIAQRFRDLADTEPDAFLPDLARSLNLLSVRLSNLGRRETAWKASEEAVTHYRQLATARPGAFIPHLAMSLNNLSNCLSALGRHEAALGIIKDAVGHYRQLAAAHSDVFLPELARSLNLLSNRLHELGRFEDALVASEEAVEHYRELAVAHAETFLPDLASSLNNQSNRLKSLGRDESALETIKKAVDIYRQLAATRPDTFLLNLAGTLNNLGIYLGDSGRGVQALEAIEEAVRIRRQLAVDCRDAYLPDLAQSLHNLGTVLRLLGRTQDARVAIDEAVTHYRELAATLPDVFLPELVRSLSNLSDCLGDLGRSEAALTASAESVSLLTPVYLCQPQLYGTWLRPLLLGYFNRCAETGKEPDLVLLQPLLSHFAKGENDA